MSPCSKLNTFTAFLNQDAVLKQICRIDSRKQLTPTKKTVCLFKYSIASMIHHKDCALETQKRAWKQIQKVIYMYLDLCARAVAGFIRFMYVYLKTCFSFHLGLKLKALESEPSRKNKKWPDCGFLRVEKWKCAM